MNTNHGVISALFDDEPFEPQALAEALADPVGRQVLIDFVLLRHVAQTEESAGVVAPEKRLRPKRLPYFVAAPPAATRVVQSAPVWTVRHGFSLRPDRCSFAVSRVVESDADLGWAVEITPVRVVNDAVTFRLAWARTRDEGKASTQPRSDTELMLRPGESIPLDFVHRPCTSQPKGSAPRCE